MKRTLSFLFVFLFIAIPLLSSCKVKANETISPSPDASSTASPSISQASQEEIEQAESLPRFESFEMKENIPSVEMQDSDIDFYFPQIIPQTNVILWVSSGPKKPVFSPSFSYELKLHEITPIDGISLITPTPKPELNFVPISTVAPFTIVEKESVFKPVPGKAFVSSDESGIRWFAYKIEGVMPESIIWQVSGIPFQDTEENWQNPTGLIDSGALSVDAGEFSIDFKQLSEMKTILGLSLNLVSQSFYVRAVAVDSDGNAMGSPGCGIEVQYGKRITDISLGSSLEQFVVLYDLLSAREQGDTYFNGEYPNDLREYSEKYYDTTRSLPLHFRPSGFPSTTDTMILQVAKAPFSNSAENYLNPAGLVFEIRLQKGDGDFENLENTTYSIPIDFNSFYEGTPALYYVRAAALTEGSKPGTEKAWYSKTVKVMCSPPGESNFEYYIPPPTEYIDMELPESRLVEYQRVRWEAPNWMYLYKVVRQPTYGDYYGSFAAFSVPNKDALMPDMPVGTIIDLTPSYREEDKSWLESAWDAVSGFFSDLAGYAVDLVNWVSTAYADLKDGLISFVADNLPLVPDKYRDELKKAIEVMVDSGLASVGIPPSLPNFDELTSMGADYIASVALESAGIPANDITKDMVKDLGSGIMEGSKAAAESGTSPNPFGWNFVRQNPDTMYRPAYIIIELKNSSDKVSPTGSLTYSVFTTLTQEQKTEAHITSIRAAFDNSLDYDLFYTMPAIPVPSLQPGESIEIPVILEEHIGHPYSFCPHVMTQNDFVKMSKYFGKWHFNVYIRYDLPPIEETITERQLPTDNVVYEYLATSDVVGFYTEAWNSIPRQ